jgi:hypothetical protein
MSRQCPECKSKSGDRIGYCEACGYRFYVRRDAVRRMAYQPPVVGLKSKTVQGMALAGLSVVVLQYMLLH